MNLQGFRGNDRVMRRVVGGGRRGWRAAIAKSGRALASGLLLLIAHTVPGLAYGPSLEPCASDGVVVEPGSDWQRRIAEARPGSVILMRGGRYELGGSLKLPDGTVEERITIKPHDCEQVTLAATAQTLGIGQVLEPGSFVTLAGLHIESDTHESLVKIRAGIQDFVLRNASLVGGRNDAFLISGGKNIVVEGNYINSGPGQRAGITASSGGHLFYIKEGVSGHGPRNIRIVGNHVEGDHFGDLVAGDDVFAVAAGHDILIANNRITNHFNVENILDIKIKNGSRPVVFRGNYASDNFKGSRGGQDHGAPAPCVTVGDRNRGPGLRHVIEGNVFDGCPGGFLSVGGGTRTGSASIVNNLFRDPSRNRHPVAGAIARSFDTEIAHNVFYGGALGIGRRGHGCDSATMPDGLVIRDNIFHGTRIIDRTDDCPTVNYLLISNVLYDLPHGFERGRQEGNLGTNPRFRSAETGDFSLLPDSPAIGAASDGQDIGLFRRPEHGQIR